MKLRSPREYGRRIDDAGEAEADSDDGGPGTASPSGTGSKPPRSNAVTAAIAPLLAGAGIAAVGAPSWSADDGGGILGGGSLPPAARIHNTITTMHAVNLHVHIPG